MGDRKQEYRNIWRSIRRGHYENGFMVSERGLQAALYAEFRKELSGVYIAVEPTWTNVGGTRRTPDLVIVEEDQITDIFELKFKPDGYARFRRDIQKLLQYGVKEERYPVELDILTGQGGIRWTVRNDCRLHFVAVANCEAVAVWPKCLMAGVPELRKNPGRLNHWFGRIGGDTDENREWSIEFDIR